MNRAVKIIEEITPPLKDCRLIFVLGELIVDVQTIASLDTYALQRQLTASLNNFRSQRNSFDLTNENAQVGVAQGQQRFALENQSKSGLNVGAEQDVINNILKHVIDTNQANLDNSVIQVELANYAVSLASIQTPINGVITHMDITSAGVNATPQTAFTIANPSALVYRANVEESDIPYIQVGSTAKITLNSNKNKQYFGTIIKIYPDKTVLPNGTSVYRQQSRRPDYAGSILARALKQVCLGYAK
jgi:multidrug resistance efflux pump